MSRIPPRRYRASLAEKRNYRLRNWLTPPIPKIWYDFDRHASLDGHARVTGAAQTPDLQKNYSRATTDMCVDATGSLREWPIDRPPFRGGKLEGNALRETDNTPASTYWNETDSTVALTTEKKNPFGGTDGVHKFTTGAGASVKLTNGVLSTGPQPTVAGKSYMCSIWVAPSHLVDGDNALDSCVLFAYSSPSAGFYMNMLTGATTTPSNMLDYGVVDGPDGWKRMWFVYTATGTQEVRLYAVKPGTTNNVTGSFAGKTFYYYAPMHYEVVGGFSSYDPPEKTIINYGTGGVWENFGTSDGLQQHPTSTNYLNYTEDFSNAASWGAACVITTNTQTAPDGTLSADDVEDDDTGAWENLTSVTASYTAGANWTASLFVRKDAVAKTTRYPLLRVSFSGGTAVSNDLTFDTSTGEISTNPGAGGVIVTSGYEEYTAPDGAEWWRFYMTSNDGSQSNTSVRITFYPAVGANANLTAYNSATTGTVTMWGAQLEPGFLTPYIPARAGSTVTRTQVSIQSDDPFLGEAISNDPGVTVFAEASLDILHNSATADLFAMFSASNNDICGYYKTGNVLYAFLRDDGVNQAVNLANNSLVQGTKHKFVTTFEKDGDVTSYSDGSAGHVDSTTNAMSEPFIHLTIGSGGIGGVWWRGTISQIAVWDDLFNTTELNDISNSGVTALWPK